MARRRRRETAAGTSHERWLVSYADFITLLFAFFVVMYALSSVNEGKYRVLTESLISAFRIGAIVPDGARSAPAVVPAVAPVLPPALQSVDPAENARREAALRRMTNMADRIRKVLAPLTQLVARRILTQALGTQTHAAQITWEMREPRLLRVAHESRRQQFRQLIIEIVVIRARESEQWRFEQRLQLGIVRDDVLDDTEAFHRVCKQRARKVFPDTLEVHATAKVEIAIRE